LYHIVEQQSPIIGANDDLSRSVLWYTLPGTDGALPWRYAADSSDV
jgi:hypothetical protein